MNRLPPDAPDATEQRVAMNAPAPPACDGGAAGDAQDRTGGEAPALLAHHLPATGTDDADDILDRFLTWASAAGFALYPAQEEAVLELMAGRHVVLGTPTGSGKSLVALALHFKALCEGKRSFYTSPIKALASEKFFALCDTFGAERVGMQTGDASINPHAPIVCCTAEVLANAALRQGPKVGADYVVMDEFHYYADPERGSAWQIPLITLPDTVFLLMSATLGNTAPIAERITAFSGRQVASIASDQRPVPLDFEYRETPLVDTVQALLDSDRAPIYIVNFTQREAAQLAQGLSSLKLHGKQDRKRIVEHIRGFRFDTPYGRECRRLLGFGIGVHHAGLLPKYRLLVEQLAQQGMLRVISGTDTLGVGVNIPIRTVLFTKLSKYDGEKVSLLKVRDFKQIAGRAGRKGFDEQGSVVCQAPEHVIEAQRAARKPGKKRASRRPPPGLVSWDEKTFERLIERPPETLQSRFRVNHGMVLNLLQYDAERDDPKRDNFDSLRALIRNSHGPDGAKSRLIQNAAQLVRSLHRAGVIKTQRDLTSNYRWVVVDHDLQWDFSLHQSLSLYLVEAIDAIDPEDPAYALKILTLVEAILEDPRVVLYRQVDRRRGELIARLKAQGMPYEERMERLDEVTYPRPDLALVEDTFAHFQQTHPWMRREALRPKSIGREMVEQYLSFVDYVRLYGLQRSEGVLLRYLSQLFKTLDQNVPEQAKDERVLDVLGFLRAMLERVDTSLLDEWQRLLAPELHRDAEAQLAARRALRTLELFEDPRAFTARVRAELHQLVHALATRDYAEAALCVRGGTAFEAWTAERFEQAMAPFFRDHERLIFDHGARRADRTHIEPVSERVWRASQVLADPEGDNRWAIEARVDLRDKAMLEGALIEIERIGCSFPARPARMNR